MTSTVSHNQHAPVDSASPSGVLVRVVRVAARGAQRRPKTIIALWLLFVIVCTGIGSMVGTKSLTDVQSEVGQSATADKLVHRAGLADPAVENVLVSSPSATRTAQAAATLGNRLSALPEVASVRGPAQSATLSTDGGTVVLVQARLAGDPDKAPDHVGAVEKTVAAVEHSLPGVQLAEAGSGSVSKSINDVISKDLSRAEKIALPITLVVLVLAFGALVAASVPLLLGLTAVAAASGALGLVSQLAPNSESTTAVVALIGLAVGVDYSLFYVRREREERRRGHAEAGRKSAAAVSPLDAASATRRESALEAAAASVGRAILVSGLTVMIALAGLLITGQGDFVSMGLGTILVVAIAVLGSLTVLPAVLALLGDRVDRGRIPGYRRLLARHTRREAEAGRPIGMWAGLARAVTARPAASLAGAVFLLAVLAVPLLGMRTEGTGVDDLPQDLPVASATHAIEKAFPGAPSDADLVVQGTGLGTGPARAELAALGRRALQITGGSGQVTVAVSHDQQLARVSVPMPDHGTSAARTTVRDLRAQVAPTADQVPGAHGSALVTGDAASAQDYSDRMASVTPEVIGFVLALGFLLLLFTFRAPLLAASVMLLNLASIGAAYGILVAVFQHTWAQGVLGFHSTGHIIDWLPLFMFVVLFGLSMDYTVLILERIREARQAGRAPRQAAAEGVAATAGTVTSAAVVMVAVFAIFGTLDVITFKQLGVGLAAAVLLDATLVRGVALPAVVALLGRRGWPVRPDAGRGRKQISAELPWDDAAMSVAGQGRRA